MDVATATWDEADASSLGTVMMWSPDTWAFLSPYAMACRQHKTVLEANRILAVPWIIKVRDAAHPNTVASALDLRRKTAFAIFQMRVFFLVGHAGCKICTDH